MVYIDTVIWMGDFNYRIGLGPERVSKLLYNHDIDSDTILGQATHKNGRLGDFIRERSG